MKVRLYLLNINKIRENRDYYSSFLGIDRLRKADKYLKDDDKLRSIGVGYLMSKHIGNEILFGESGKPYCDGGPYFNASHSGEYSALAVCDDADIGLDIERIREYDQKIIERFYSKEEKEYARNNKVFYEIWTSKESMIKCHGSGIKSILAAPGIPTNGKKEFKGEPYFSKQFNIDGYALSITLKCDDDFDVIIETI